MIKKEHQAKNPTAKKMRWWNEDGNKPKYTIAEHRASNPTADEKRWWNEDGNKPKYTEEEIKKKEKFNSLA